MTNPTPSEFDAKLKDGIALGIYGRFYINLNPDQFEAVNKAVANSRAAVREIVPKKRTIDNDHEYIDNTFNKGRNAAIAEMLAGIGGKDNA
jgi:hypothetical protein